MTLDQALYDELTVHLMKNPGGEGYEYIKYAFHYFTDILTMYSARA